MAAGAADERAARPAHPADFYALPFAPQMIVWAVRKRFLALAHDDEGTDMVAQVFRMADWGELYAALLTIVDIFVGADVHRRFPQHAVSCPCLSGHEAGLLNAMAHLQSGCRAEAALTTCEILPPAAARLAMPQMQAVIDEITARELRFAFVDVETHPEASVSTAPGSSQAGHVH